MPHRDGDRLPMKGRGERDPIVAAGLHHHSLDRTIAGKPALELRQACAIRAEAQDRLVRGALTLPTDRRDVLAFADVDADAVHAMTSPRSLPSGELACSGPRLLIVDHRPAPSAAAESRSPSTDGVRGPDTSGNGSNRIARDRPPRESQRKSDSRRGPISAWTPGATRWEASR